MKKIVVLKLTKRKSAKYDEIVILTKKVFPLIQENYLENCFSKTCHWFFNTMM